MFEENPWITFFASCVTEDGGYITENGEQIVFDGGRMVEVGTQITLRAVANEGYTFKGWGCS